MKKVDMLSVVEGYRCDNHFMVLEFEKCGLIVPLVVSDSEAEYLEYAISGVEPPRPMPYNLAKTILTEMDGKLDSVYLTLDEGGRATGVLSVRRGEYEVEVLCSVADAGAMSKLCNVDLMLDTQIFEKVRYIDRYGLDHSDHKAVDAVLGLGAASFISYKNA